MYNIYMHVTNQLAKLCLHSESVVSPFTECCRLSTDCSIPATVPAMCIVTLNIKRNAGAGKDFGDAVIILSI